MDAIAVFGLGSLKALLMLLIAGGIALTLRRRPARLRAVVWGTALVGSLLIPLAAAVVPALPVVLPVELPQLTDEDPRLSPMEDAHLAHQGPLPGATVTTTVIPLPQPPVEEWSLPSVDRLLMTIWAGLALVFFGYQLAQLGRMAGIIRRARPVTDEAVLDLAADVCAQVGCRQRIRIAASPEIDIPAVFGVVRPVIILPAHYRTWLEDRLTAVLQHELIHVIRLDWPVRIAARLACAIYWFNPLVWWAKRRLDLEQEIACDEEVLSLGTRASSYACHLLGIARTAVHREALAVAGLEMARRSHLEERIMTILNRSKHRKVGLAVILPAAIFTAALVPAIAAVQPTEPGPREASPELKAAMAEMEEAEQRIEPYLERITERELRFHPHIEKLKAIEVDIDHEAMARIEAEMEPILEQIRDVTIDMEPVHAQLEAMHEALESVELHIEDGTFREIQEQIHQQMEAHRFQLESVHIDMEPFHEQIEALQAQLKPFREQMEALHFDAALSHEEMERHQAEMEQFHDEMEAFHQEMEPLHEEMELLGQRIETALHNDVAAVLRSHLGSVTSPSAPFNEAAARIVEEGNIHVDDDILELDVSRREAREILTDLFTPSRVGTQDTFDSALESAVDDISDLEIRVD